MFFYQITNFQYIVNKNLNIQLPMETSTLCNTAPITPFVPTADNLWDVTKAAHVFRRLSFGSSQSEIDDALALTPSDFIDQLVDQAFSLAPTTTPPWGYWSLPDFADYDTENNAYIEAWRTQTGYDMFQNKLRDRLTFFWMNHFVTELDTYFYSPYMFQYYNINQTHALGNFRDFVRAIGTSGAMLFYLNGFQNTAANPNENYARELFELFTLGVDNNYTEEDIQFTAKALTGWNHWAEVGGAIYFDESTWNPSVKNIFGQAGLWKYDDVIDILFQQRSSEIATYICTKLYTFFVSYEVSDFARTEIIDVMAATFIDNDFELAPVLKQLFKSEHFFNERALGVIVKSPFDALFSFTKDTELTIDDTIVNGLIYYAAVLGQEMYEPVDVAGWQGDHDWISSSTLTGRWQVIELLSIYILNNYPEDLRNFAINISGDSNDPEFITSVIVDRLMSKEFYTASDYDVATDIFKGDVPQGYYDDGTWNLYWDTAPAQVAGLLIHLSKAPEFQLK